MADYDYAETLFQSIDVIAQKMIDNVNYNSTRVCTIVDATYADQGKYQVTDGSVKFYAYCTVTDYKVKDTVYVSIPNNNFNEEKFIIGKYTSEDTTPFVYTSPFDTMIDVSTNLIEKDLSEETSLLANYPWDKTPNYSNKLIWERDFSKIQLIDFTRLGIQAQFRSWLEDCVSGDYGLMLEVTAEKSGTATNQQELESIYHFYLNCEDMYGNPYNFQSFYQQENVFDISSIGKITYMRLYFYESEATFKTKDGKDVAFADFLGNPVTPNLFVKDPYICVGYNLADFNDEQATLYTISSKTYTNDIQVVDANGNEKQIFLRWLHEDENDDIVTLQDDDEKIDYEVRYYRYQLGKPNADEYCGVYWTALPHSGFEFTFNPDIALEEEQLKAIILLYKTNEDTDERYVSKVIQSNILTFANERPVINPATATYTDGLNIICADGSYGNYRVYDNGNELLDSSFEGLRMDAVAYFNPFDSNEDSISILTEAESITWVFPRNNTQLLLDNFDYSQMIPDDSYYKKIDGDLDGEEHQGYLCNYSDGYFTNRTEVVFSEPSEICYIWYDEEKIYIKRFGIKEKGYVINPYQLYGINSYYSSYNTNNTLQCIIEKDNVEYTSYKEFTFGIAGTTGTDCTLELDLENNEWALTADTPQGGSVRMKAVLYDANNKPVDLDSEAEIEWSWYDKFIPEGGSEPVFSKTSKDTEIEIFYDEDLDVNTFLIMQCTIKNWGGQYDLTALKAIPVREYVDETYSYHHVEGPATVVYSTLGDYTALKVPYSMTIKRGLEYNQFEDDFSFNWQIYNPHNESYQFIGNIDQSTGVLKPCAMYISGAKPYGIQCRVYTKEQQESIVENYAPVLTAKQKADEEYEKLLKIPEEEETNRRAQLVLWGAAEAELDEKQEIFDIFFNELEPAPTVIWTQPIVVTQNNYPSSTMNKWEGKDIEIDYDKGTITAPAIAAGKKESDNTFTGLMLGDWSGVKGTSSAITASTGLYGFNHGAMSYGFKDDGTAFIGKSGAGRITFDGNSGQISSGLREITKDSGKLGMLIDLDDGIIDIRGANGVSDITDSTGLINNGKGYTITKKNYAASGKSVYISANGNGLNPYFRINDTPNHSLILVSDSYYYLQSADFYDGYEQGFRLDIKNGRIYGYNFGLKAGSGGHYIEIDSSYSLGTEKTYYFGGLNNGKVGCAMVTLHPGGLYPIKINSNGYTFKEINQAGAAAYARTVNENGDYTNPSDYRYSAYIESIGNGFAVNWAGEVFMKAGIVGNMFLSEDGLYSVGEYKIPDCFSPMLDKGNSDENDTSDTASSDDDADSSVDPEDEMDAPKVRTASVKVGLSTVTGNVYGGSFFGYGWVLGGQSVYSRIRLPEGTKGRSDKENKNGIGGLSVASINSQRTTDDDFNTGIGASLYVGYHRNFYVSSISGSVYINYRGRNKRSRTDNKMYVYIGSRFGPIYKFHLYAQDIYFHAAYKCNGTSKTYQNADAKTAAEHQHGIYARFA